MTEFREMVEGLVAQASAGRIAPELAADAIERACDEAVDTALAAERELVRGETIDDGAAPSEWDFYGGDE